MLKAGELSCRLGVAANDDVNFLAARVPSCCPCVCRAQVYVLNRDTASRLAISSPLEAHKSHSIIFHTCGVDVGFDNPIFAVSSYLSALLIPAVVLAQSSESPRFGGARGSTSAARV